MGGYDDYDEAISVNNNEGQSLIDHSQDSPKKVFMVERSASWFSSFVNLANTILGAGMLGLPFALSKNGLALGSVFIILCGIASAFGLYLLIQCTDIVGGQTSYYVLARKAFHPRAAVLIDLIVFIKCFGVAISYLTVIGDLMPDVSQYFLGPDVVDSILLNRNFWIGVLGVLIIPTTMLRQLNSLRFTSGLALIAVGYLFLMVITMFAIKTETVPGERKMATMDLCFFSIMTIYVFGFTCHQNIFSIYNELSNPTPRRINSVIFSAIGSAGVIYLVIGVLGYAQYGYLIDDNIINNYPQDVIATTVGRIFIVILVAFSVALQTHPARICLDNLYKFFAATVLKKEDIGPMTNMRFYAETLFIIGGVYLIGLLVDSLSTVLAFVGAIGSTTMCYILPGLFYLRFTGLQPLTPSKIGALLMVAIGSFVMPTALVFVFVSQPECDPPA